jgi:hypothetical protein
MIKYGISNKKKDVNSFTKFRTELEHKMKGVSPPSRSLPHGSATSYDEP